MSSPRPCRARLRLHTQTVSQAGSRLPEFPAAPLPCEKIHPFHFVPLLTKQTTNMQRNQALEIVLKPSCQLAFLLVIAHGIAVAVVWVLELPIELHIALKLAIAASLIYALLQNGWLGLGTAPVTLRVIPAHLANLADTIELRLRNGSTMRGSILAGSFVAPYLTVLRFQSETARRFSPGRSLVVFPDSLDGESFRALRVRLKWGHTAGV